VTFEAPRNAYFNISMPEFGPGGDLRRDLILPSDVIELSITEEMHKSVQGSFTLNDPSLMYGRILRPFAPANISWGYKANGAPVESLFGAGTADLFTQNLERRGLKVAIINPSGSATGQGNATFSCGFLSQGWFGKQSFTTYDSGTKETVLRGALTRMNVASSFILFDAANDSYSSESVERQSETDFQFVARLALEWRCLFKLGFAQDGTTYAVFCEPKYIPMAQTTIAGAVKSMWLQAFLSWKSGDINDFLCISYDWKNEEGENGAGDNVKIVYVNGQPTYQRFTMQADTVTVWTLDTKAVDEFVRKGHDIGPILNATDFNSDEIQQFWIPAKQTTAPNGLGYTVNVHMLGNPVITAGMSVFFNHGFPAHLTRTKTGGPLQFFVRRVSHTLNMQGYFTDLEVVDLPTISATGFM